ncbi:cytochrome P450 [Streptomyces sp. NPDC127039]|uniref:cytochrome P450 n=1 Tax=Streptomyces sp. NPDC127039 TaxID=3347115 RepID=UPI003649FF01
MPTATAGSTALDALFTSEGRADPYPHYGVLREHARVLTVTDGLLLVSGHAELEAALRHPQLEVHDAEFNARYRPGIAGLPSISVFADSMLMGRSPGHERVRRLVSGAFTPRRLHTLTDQIRSSAVELAARLERHCVEDGAGDFMAEVAYPLPLRVIGDLLGVPRQDLAWFRPLVSDLAKTMDPQLTPKLLDAADLAAVDLLAYFDQLVAERRRQPRQDMVSALVEVHDSEDGRLSDSELRANLVLMFVAGFETTANLLGNALSLLLDHSDHAAALRADPAAYVQEVLRFDSPIQITGRWAVSDLEFAGVQVPEGSNLMLLLGAGNRDPRRFDAPDTFDPGRADNRPLSFGSGPHYCLGAALARMEAQIALPLVLDRLPRLRRAAPAVRGEWLTVRGYASLPVGVTEAAPETTPEATQT